MARFCFSCGYSGMCLRKGACVNKNCEDPSLLLLHAMHWEGERVRKVRGRVVGLTTPEVRTLLGMSGLSQMRLVQQVLMM